MESTCALTDIGSDNRLTITVLTANPEELRALLNEGFRQHRDIVLNLSWLPSIPVVLFEVMASAEMKARTLGAALQILCSAGGFQALTRLGWTDDCLKVSALPHLAAAPATPRRRLTLLEKLLAPFHRPLAATV